ncbi:unnamed protein product [Phaeothamnion confervicola]
MISPLADAYNKDPDPQKILLGIGVYRDDDGLPWVLPSVRKAERQLTAKDLNHEYALPHGIPDFLQHALRFAYGEDSVPLKEMRIAAVQTMSGTGACRLAAELFAKVRGHGAAVYLPQQTWGNHEPILTDAGLVARHYRYYDPATCGLDFEGLLEDIDRALDGSIVLLHACAHNPTGVDPTPEQWREISALIKRKNHFVLFDCAYQGFASGDAEWDAAALRQFVADGHRVALAHSFAKNFGLYGERVGSLSVVCADPDEAARVASHLTLLIRSMYLSPPIHGARLVSEVLGSPELFGMWQEDCQTMARRIAGIRRRLREELEGRLGSRRGWRHVTEQVGMFCYTGLSLEEVAALRRDAHVYMLADGRISMAGLNSGNVARVAESIFKVTG